MKHHGHENLKGRPRHHDRGHHASGGKTLETPESGKKEWEEDKHEKEESYTAKPNKVESESKERKAGGKAKQKGGAVAAKQKGGAIAKKVGGGLSPAAKQVGGVVGAASAPTAARAPRKSGGRSGCDSNPFSSARHGTDPKGHKTVDVD
jgi:hypothetical protein